MTGIPNDETPITFIGNANVDLSTLSQREAADYRRELIHALHNPGMEFDTVGELGEADRKTYHDKLKQVDAYLLTFEEQI